MYDIIIKDIGKGIKQMSKKYLVTGIREIKKENFQEIKNNMWFCKPSGGLWSSPYYEKGIVKIGEKKIYNSPWQVFTGLEFQDKYYNYGVVYSLKKGSRIAYINSLKDLKEFAEEYQLEPPEKDWGFSRFLNYEKMAEDYDGIFLSTQGERETRFSEPFNLYGWDVATMFLFNLDCIKNQEYIEFNY